MRYLSPLMSHNPLPTPRRCSTEETNKRLGKGRKAAKLRGPVAAFVDRMKLEDLEDGVLDQVDWFAAQDALPDEDDAVGFLAREVGMTPAEVAFFLPALNEAVALEAEVNAAVSAPAAAGGSMGRVPRHSLLGKRGFILSPHARRGTRSRAHSLLAAGGGRRGRRGRGGRRRQGKGRQDAARPGRLPQGPRRQVAQDAVHARRRGGGRRRRRRRCVPGGRWPASWRCRGFDRQLHPLTFTAPHYRLVILVVILADASDRLTPEEKAALAAEVEALKPALAAWREKHASKLQAHYTRALAAAKEEALARGEADAL